MQISVLSLHLPFLRFYLLSIVELAILAFRRTDYISFIGYMRRFKSLMKLSDLDDPQCHFPVNGSFFTGSFIVDIRSEPMTPEEAESLVRQGSEDPTMVGVLKELDDIQLKTVSLLEKGKKSSFLPSKDNCTSLVVLEMQAYYFYWTLVLLLAGDFSNATRFAKYSDRVYKYLTTFPKELPPRYVHLTIIGNVSDLVCYVKKTFEIGESLNQKGRYGDFQIALIRMFDKAPAGICFNQLYERSIWVVSIDCRGVPS